MIRETIALAFARSFTPDPVDRKVRLAERFTRRPLIAVTFLENALEASRVSFVEGQPVFTETELFNFGEADSDATFLRTYAARHDASEVAINLQYGFTAMVSNRVKLAGNRADNLDQMQYNPEKILGEPEQMRLKHALATHPTHNFSLRFDFQRSDLDRIATIMAKAGLTVVHFHCGMVDLINFIIARHWSGITSETAFIFVDARAVFTCLLEPRALGQPGFSMDTAAQDLREEVGSRLTEILRPGRKVILINDSPVDVAAMIAEREMKNEIITPLEGMASPELHAVCADTPDHYAYDLYPNEQRAKPFAPRSYIIVPVLFWTLISVSGLCGVVNSYRHLRAESQLNELTQQKNAIALDMTSLAQQTTAFKTKEDLAHDLRDWVALAPPTQGFWVKVTEALRGHLQVQNMSIDRIPGQPQMRLVITVSAAEREAYEAFNQVSAVLKEEGYKTIDFKTYTVPNGYQYDHLLNVPVN
jgi:hypothetical protein